MLLFSLPSGIEWILIIISLFLIFIPAIIVVKIRKKPLTFIRVLKYTVFWILILSIIGQLLK